MGKGSILLISIASGNQEFTLELSKWVFQEKSVLRINHHKHHRKGETNQHGIYRIKDDMVLGFKNRFILWTW
jgi:hypothetical protein